MQNTFHEEAARCYSFKLQNEKSLSSSSGEVKILCWFEGGIDRIHVKGEIFISISYHTDVLNG